MSICPRDCVLQDPNQSAKCQRAGKKLGRGKRVDRYKTMQTFVQVAKYGSLTAAARSLGISRALVSRQITDLERRLRVRLLNRSTRLVSLTEPGRRHFAFCERLLGEITEESMSLLGNEGEIEGLVSVAAPEFAGDLDVGDALTQFSARYPKIKIELVVGELLREHGALENAFDLVLQTKHSTSPSTHAQRVAQLRYAICASPTYLAGIDMPRAPADLARLRCLVHANETTWRLSHAGRSRKITVEPVFSSNSFEVLTKAAVQGLGIAPLPERLAERALKDRRLVRVLPGWRLPVRSLYALVTRQGAPPRRVLVLIDFLSAWFARN
jgi:DNA-binding transcriptional LysR family regulator